MARNCVCHIEDIYFRSIYVNRDHINLVYYVFISKICYFCLFDF